MLRLVLAIAAIVIAGVSARAQQDAARLVAECDRLAANDLDSGRPAGVPGMPPGMIDAQAAVPACLAAARAKPGNWRTLYQFGRALEVAKQRKKARAVFNLAHRAGYAPASMQLGLMHRLGQGGPRDQAEARNLFRKAAASGHPGAMRMLGLVHARAEGGPQDMAQAQQWFQQALAGYEKLAAAGSPSAMWQLAVMHQNGEGMPKDIAKMWRWREQAGARSHPAAMFSLGVRARNQGNYAEAMAWWKKGLSYAVKGGSANEIGHLFENGQGVARDVEEARRWYGIGAKVGNENAAKNLESPEGGITAADRAMNDFAQGDT